MDNIITHKLDIELIRTLLVEIEAMGLNDEPFYTEDVRKCYHLMKMIEGGLVEGTSRPDPFDAGWGAEIRDITYKGHEFLHATSGAAVWNKIKQVALEKGIGLTIGHAIKIASDYIPFAM